MYIFVRAILRSVAPNSKYVPVNIQSMTLDQIFKEFVDGFIELEHSDVSVNFYVPLNRLREAVLPQSPFNFNTWLASVSNIALPTYEEEPRYIDNQVSFSDAFQIGAGIQRVQPLTLSSAPEFPLGVLRDLMLTIDGVEVQTLYNYVLVSVNGYLHATYFSRRGLVVVDGGKTMDVCQANKVGLLSFESIGEIEVHPIQSSMVVGESLQSNVMIKLGRPIKNKKVIMVIGGVMYIENGIYRVIDHEQGIINFNTFRVDLLKQMILARRRIDLSSLNFTPVPNDPEGLYRSEAYSNDTIRAYFSLKQSFVVLVDADHLYAKRELLAQTPIPGLYESHERVTSPMVDTYGRICEFVQQRTVDGSFTLRVAPEDFINNELYNTTSRAGVTTFYGANTQTGYAMHQGMILNIGSQYLSFDPA